MSVKSVQEWMANLSLLNGIIIPRQCTSVELKLGTQESSTFLKVNIRDKRVDFFIGIKGVTMRKAGTFKAKINHHVHTRKNISITGRGNIMFTIDRPKEEIIYLQEFSISDS